MVERPEHCHYWGAGIGTVIFPSLAPLFHLDDEEIMSDN